MSFAEVIPTAPPDAVFALAARAKADTDPRKIDCSAGVYKDASGASVLLPAVKKAQDLCAAAGTPKDYLGIAGHLPFTEEAVKLLYGADSPAIKEGRVARVQCLSGTGGLRLAAELFHKFYPASQVYISHITWPNHVPIFTFAGFAESAVHSFPYFDKATNGVDFKGMMDTLKGAPDKAIVLVQQCGHNPTGADMTKDQWVEFAALAKAKSLLVLVDNAYQGYATGDIEGDAFPARLLVDQGLEFSVVQSFAKNFGLYNDRVGCLSFVCKAKEAVNAIESQLKVFVRPMYSNPPRWGADLVHRILSTPDLRAQWISEVKAMAARIAETRALLRKELEARIPSKDWSHVTTQIGMFSFTGIEPDVCELMADKKHVYLFKSGRVSVAGLNAGNCAYFAEATAEAMKDLGKL